MITLGNLNVKTIVGNFIVDLQNRKSVCIELLNNLEDLYQISHSEDFKLVYTEKELEQRLNYFRCEMDTLEQELAVLKEVIDLGNAMLNKIEEQTDENVSAFVSKAEEAIAV